jgi:gamma-glutamyltranspeptidase/glutathione hydrolase
VEGSSRLVLGTRGGSYQPQLILQVLASIALSGSGAAGAQAAPRWIVDGFQAGAGHRVSVEPDTDAGVVSGLRARNHDVVVVEGPQEGWGPVSLIALTPGGAAGFADPRVSTTAAGFQR